MNLKTRTIEKNVDIFNIFGLLWSKETTFLHVPLNLSQSPGLPTFHTSSKRFPVRILDLELKDDRSILVDGKHVEIPAGTKEKITVGALKVLAGSYTGSLMLEKKGKGSVRLKDEEIIELPNNGSIELTIIPSFKTE